MNEMISAQKMLKKAGHKIFMSVKAPGVDYFVLPTTVAKKFISSNCNRPLDYLTEDFLR